MSEVIDLAERRKKKEKEPKKKNSSKNDKLYEALTKFGSTTGNVMKELFKKKEKLGEDENV